MGQSVMSERGTDIFDKLHEYSLDLKRRRVFLFGPIHPSWDFADECQIGYTDFVVRNLLWLDCTAGPIELWINTYGGSLDEMWAIYDAMKIARNPVHTIAIGSVCSAGCLLLAGGTGTRYSTPFCNFMWHGGTDTASGLVPQEFQDRAAWTERDRKRWVEEMARHTKPVGCRSQKERAKFWDHHTRAKELWFDAPLMKKNGIIDEIWTGEEE